MFSAIYQIAISLLALLVRLLAKFNSRIQDFKQLRKNGPVPEHGPRKYWVHCASLGEYEMALPLLETLAAEHGAGSLLISFFSPSGMQYASKHPEFGNQMVYLPYDDRKSVKAFYDRYQPTKAILVRYELWYNLMSIGLNRGVEFYMINARFLKGHFIFKWFAGPYRKLLKQFVNIFTSDKRSDELLKAKGFENSSFTGDTRFDRVKAIQHSAVEYAEIDQFKNGKPLLILGSTYFYEENMLNEILHELPEVKIIVAPHNIQEDRILQIETTFTAYQPKLWSGGGIGKDDKLLILDSIGMLSSVYRYADVAFVGGGFTGALHNVIEPAVWGNVICYGPIFDKYPEATAFIQAGFGTAVKDSKSLLAALSEVLLNTENLRSKKVLATNFVDERLGATKQIIKAII